METTNTTEIKQTLLTEIIHKEKELQRLTNLIQTTCGHKKVQAQEDFISTRTLLTARLRDLQKISPSSDVKTYERLLRKTYPSQLVDLPKTAMELLDKELK